VEECKKRYVCPLIKVCKNEVDVQHFLRYCLSTEKEEWKKCPYSNVKVKPIEWLKGFTGYR